MDRPSNILKFPDRKPQGPAAAGDDPIVITGIGIACSLGNGREHIWQEIQRGTSGVRLTRETDPVGSLRVPAAMVDWLDNQDDETGLPSSIKSIRLSDSVASEALQDADIDWDAIDRERFACSISAQFGDIDYMYMDKDVRDNPPANHPQKNWFSEFLPCSAASVIGDRYGLLGPRLCHTTACASGLVSTITAARMLSDGQADFALCGATDAVTQLVFTAFNRMGVLSHGPDVSTACKPFDKNRNGFVMGEGGAMMVLERRSHAIARGAKIYAELTASATMCQAHHVTGLDDQSQTLNYLISRIMKKSGWEDCGPQYISAHGTGTEQNDKTELLAIRESLADHADDLFVSSNKAVVGHLINAAGSIELALTAMALRDGYAPPTMHLDNPETIGNIDCLPKAGHAGPIDRALKLSLAFGGHLVGVSLSRFNEAASQRLPRPLVHDALIRNAPAISARAA
ncbi:MAG: beta-ketoacyl-ACP synthase II [Aureliella sp.]